MNKKLLILLPLLLFSTGCSKKQDKPQPSTPWSDLIPAKKEVPWTPIEPSKINTEQLNNILIDDHNYKDPSDWWNTDNTKFFWNYGKITVTYWEKDWILVKFNDLNFGILYNGLFIYKTTMEYGYFEWDGRNLTTNIVNW